MRKLMWFVTGFVAVCILTAYFPLTNICLIPGILMLATGAGLCFVRKRSAMLVALILLGIGASALWNFGYSRLYLDAARRVDGKILPVEITVSDFSYETNYGMGADGIVKLEGKPFSVRMYLDSDSPLKPGDLVKGKFRFRLTAAGGEEDATHHQGEGIFLLAYAQKKSKVQYGNHIPILFYPAVLRRNILTALEGLFPEDTVGFAKALLLGDSTGLGYELDTAFKVSGVRHVIAVSGLHVSILFALVYTLCGKHRVMTALMGIPILVLFAAIAGFTPSILRACGMQCLMILAMLLKREYDPPTALAFSVLAMLLWNPLAVTSVSFQLSVGCMIGIFLFCPKLNDRLLHLFHCPKKKSLRKILTDWVAGSASVTLSAMAITTPLSAMYFETVSIAGIATNLLTLWVISFVFYGIMLALLLGIVWLPLGKIVAWVVSWPIRYVLLIAQWIAEIPFAAVYTCSIYIVLWLVLCYILFAVLLLSKRRRLILTAACLILSLLASVFASWLEPRLDSFRVTVLDVGQGQCILLQSRGKHYLVDCGGDTPGIAADRAAAQLLSQGITCLDGVILTHYDSDHAAGVPNLLSRVDTKMLYLPDIPDDTGIKKILSDSYGDSIAWIRKETFLQGDWGKLTMLPGNHRKDENESSLCILFQAEKCDILITGDRSTVGERALYKQYPLPEVELLIAGHHGAGDSTGFELLSKTRPRAVAISVSKDNDYGHPAPELLKRLKDFDCAVFRTDLDGTILFRR